MKLINGNKNKPGYKKTQIGWLPKEWESKQIGELSEVLFSNVDKKIKDSEQPVFLCNYMNVYYNDYITEKINFMQATASEREIKKYSLKQGDVIITKDSETFDDIVVSTLVNKELSNLLCGYHLAVIRPDRKRLLGEYLTSLFKLHPIRHYFSTLANGVTRFGLNNSSVNHALIPIPPLSEQKKIAKILSTWDQAIELMNKLIDANQQLKKGLMQKLLTGKVRFPGFSDEWREVRLGEVFEQRNEMRYDHLPLLAVTRTDGVVYRDTLERRDTSNPDKSKYKRICPGDIGYNTMRMWQGISVLSKLEGIVSPAYTIVTPKDEIDSVFTSYFFKHHPIVFLFYRYS